MTSAYLHLLMAHVPVVGTLFGAGLLIVAILRKSDEQKRTALALICLASLLALPTYLSGQPAAMLLKRFMPGMPPDAGDQHAEVAILALGASLFLGAVALTGLLVFRKDKKLPAGYLVLLLFLALIGGGLLAWTANLGAKIRHAEIRRTASVSATQMPV